MRIILITLVPLIIFIGCAGSYNKNFNPNNQVALIYLGASPGNRILFFNKDKFPKLAIYRKTETDSTFNHVKTLNINKISLRYKVGDHGPGFAYDWNDPENSEITTRYKVQALDDSSNLLVELKNIYGIPDENGEWKHIEE